jgi:hypothetical protein
MAWLPVFTHFSTQALRADKRAATTGGACARLLLNINSAQAGWRILDLVR